MKKEILLLFCLCVIITMQAVVHKTIRRRNNNSSLISLRTTVYKNVNLKAGGLEDSLTSKEKLTITDLKIFGTINAHDFKIMRDNMPSLVVLNLENAKIEEYKGDKGTYEAHGEDDSEYAYYYPENIIPVFCFLNHPLKSVILPNTVTRIESNAFMDCQLCSIVYGKSVHFIGNYAFYNCKLGNDLIIPNSIDTIGIMAFGEGNYKSIKIPKSVKYIDLLAFEGVSYFFNDIYIDIETPPYLDESYLRNYPNELGYDWKVDDLKYYGKNIYFGNINYTPCTLHVPKGSKDVYRNSKYWGDFVNIIENK
jgi:hypothetical protein